MYNNIDRDGKIILDSVNATHAHERVSGKYSFIPTTKVIDIIKENGWMPVKAQEVNARKHQGFQKHLIRFRQHADQNQFQIHDLIPEIVLTNSHSGTAAFNIMAGIFRVICSNGLVVADSMFASHRITHKGFKQQSVIDAVYNVIEDCPKIMNRVNEFKSIELSPSEREVFGKAALQLITTEEQKEEINFDISAKRIITPLRTADVHPSLWNTYNVVQEKIIKGGRYIKKQRLMESAGYLSPKKREVKSIDKNISLNKALWTLTEEMAEIKKRNVALVSLS